MTQPPVRAPYEILEITRPDDPMLPDWLELYETAFPAPERVLVADHLRVLHRKAHGEVTDDHLLAAVDAGGRVLALARYLSADPGGAACLWHLAVAPERRGGGIGAAMYREVLRRLLRDGVATLLLEVEIPETAAPEETRSAAERRIAFYRRLGARVLAGINYLQVVGPHQPPIPMHLMVHLLQPGDPGSAFAAARGLFGSNVAQTGPLRLE